MKLEGNVKSSLKGFNLLQNSRDKFPKTSLQ